MKKTRLILLLGGLLMLALPFFYRPVKENQIYQRNIKLPEDSKISEESLEDNKMIQQAKNALENLFGIQIEKKDYNISVEYETSQISAHTMGNRVQNLVFANIGFEDKETSQLKYVVECDTTTGEILMITQQYNSPMGDSYKPIEELQTIAQSFMVKMTNLSEEDIIYIDDEVQGSTYRANITMKNTYEQVVLYIDAFDGTVFYYGKMS